MRQQTAVKKLVSAKKKEGVYMLKLMFKCAKILAEGDKAYHIG